MPPTQFILSGKVAPPPNFGGPYVVSTRCRSLGGTQGRGQGDPRGTPKEPKGPKGLKGTQGDPRGPEGAFGALWGG